MDELLFAINRTAFKIGNLTVQWYGIIITTAMLLGLVLLITLGKRKGLTSDDMIELFLWIIPLAVLCGRLLYVFVRLSPEDGYFPINSWGFKEFFSNRYAPSHSFLNLFALWEGGITIIGGVIGGILGGIIFVKRKKVKLSVLFDICMPIVLLCQAIGRWGNFINQECFGSEITNPAFQWFPFAVYIDRLGGYYAAAFFYAFVWNLIGAVLIYFLSNKISKEKGIDGTGAFMYLAWYCTKRFFMEFIRVDAVATDSGFKLTQFFMALCALAGIVGGILYYRYQSNKIEHNIVALEVKKYIDDEAACLNGSCDCSPKEI